MKRNQNANRTVQEKDYFWAQRMLTYISVMWEWKHTLAVTCDPCGFQMNFPLKEEEVCLHVVHVVSNRRLWKWQQSFCIPH